MIFPASFRHRCRTGIVAGFCSVVAAIFLIVAGGIVAVAGEQNSATTKVPQKKSATMQAKKSPATKAGFRFEKDAATNGFEITRSGDAIVVKAANEINFRAGVGYFQKHFQKIHRSWNGDRLEPLVPASEFTGTLKIPEQWSVRYAYNYCTLSYTSAFWGKAEWHSEIEKMSLNGVTHALVQAGLEKVWQLTLRELGYPKEKIAAFIPDPAAAAWWNMGNLEGLGGPLSQRQIDEEAKLGKFIVAEMVANGMKPVLQGFVGLVPHDFESSLPDKTKRNLGELRVIDQGKWVDDFVRPAVVDPTCAAFPKLAKIWYKNLEKVYGIKAEAFAGDLFHEGGNSKGIDVAAAAKSVQSAMLAASPQSRWFIQHWGANPSKELLSGIDKSKCLVLSLTRDMANGSNGENRRSFSGAPWAWCELLNFGGNHGLYGSLKTLASLGNLQRAPEFDKLVGIGMLSEGTGTNPIFYDLFFDRFWMKKSENMDAADLEKWIEDYALRRYGKNSADAVEALKILERSVYSPRREQEGCTESIFCARPGRTVAKASTWSSGDIYYNPADVLAALEKFVAAAEKNPELLKTETFRYDLADTARQFLSDLARPLLAETMAEFDKKNAEKFEQNSKLFLAAISATDDILATHRLWRFGEIFEQAQRKGATAAEKRAYETAAKRMITTWTGRTGMLNDYAHRQLAGLMKDYYFRRWQIFFSAYSDELKSRNPAKIKALDGALEKFEASWLSATQKYTAQEKGDTLAETKKAIAKFGALSRKFFKLGDVVETGAKWTLRDGASELVFDVSGDIMVAGKYKAEFVRTSGDNDVKILGVKLYNGDNLVAEDAHAGTCGAHNNDNVFHVEVKKLRTGLGAYTLKASVAGDGGNNAEGVMRFEKE